MATGGWVTCTWDVPSFPTTILTLPLYTFQPLSQPSCMWLLSNAALPTSGPSDVTCIPKLSQVSQQYLSNKVTTKWGHHFHGDYINPQYSTNSSFALFNFYLPSCASDLLHIQLVDLVWCITPTSPMCPNCMCAMRRRSMPGDSHQSTNSSSTLFKLSFLNVFIPPQDSWTWLRYVWALQLHFLSTAIKEHMWTSKSEWWFHSSLHFPAYFQSVNPALCMREAVDCERRCNTTSHRV